MNGDVAVSKRRKYIVSAFDLIRVWHMVIMIEKVLSVTTMLLKVLKPLYTSGFNTLTVLFVSLWLLLFYGWMNEKMGVEITLYTNL